MKHHRMVVWIVLFSSAALLGSGSVSAADMVTSQTFCRAESDRVFRDIASKAGGLNRFDHVRAPAPLDNQTAVRMNRDTLYSFAVVDVSKPGATLTIPAIPDGRYATAYLLDNDHYAVAILSEPGTHPLPAATPYLAIGLRVQVRDARDAAEIAAVNRFQDQFTIASPNATPLPPSPWDKPSLDRLRTEYEAGFQKFARYPSDWQGKRGTVNEQTRQMACSGAWGLLPETEAVYLNYSGGHPASVCHKATYAVPENKAFWSITIYGSDGYIKNDNSVLNAANTKLNADGTFTAHFGSRESCGEVANRVDVPEGWNFLLRVYRPGPSVLDGSYKLPAALPART